MISGIQWDVTMATIDKKKDGNGNDYYVTEARDDRHIETETNTGQNIADKVYNIYDLEGNYMEYTAEIILYVECYGIPCIIRGGDSYTTSSAANRWDFDGSEFRRGF